MLLMFLKTQLLFVIRMQDYYIYMYIFLHKESFYLLVLILMILFFRVYLHIVLEKYERSLFR
jgi:hypothetical protein